MSQSRSGTQTNRHTEFPVIPFDCIKNVNGPMFGGNGKEWCAAPLRSCEFRDSERVIDMVKWH
jgi:hypothetical protein